MAEKKQNRSRSKPKEPAVKGGVLVRLIDAPAGEVRRVNPIGATKLTEAPTLLRLAAKDIEREMGID